MLDSSEKIKKRVLSEKAIQALNIKYKALTPTQRIQALYSDFEVSEVMLTSSFAATSAFLLKLFSDVNKTQKVFFIDTGYHFEDTIAYKEKLRLKAGKLYLNLGLIEKDFN